MNNSFERSQADAVEQVDVPPLEPVVWFNEHTELRSVSPYVAMNSDVWVVEAGGEVVGMALVEAGEVHRLGVTPERRREGVAESMIDTLNQEYGELQLACRESLPANKFYEATGWEQTGVRWGDPEDMVEWRLADGE